MQTNHTPAGISHRKFELNEQLNDHHVPLLYNNSIYQDFEIAGDKGWIGKARHTSKFRLRI